MVTGLLGTPQAPPPGLSFPICLCWQSSRPGTPRSPQRRPGGAPGVTCSQAGGEAPGLTEVGPVRDDEPLLPVFQACGHGTRSATGPPLGTWGHPPASPRAAVSSRAPSRHLPEPTFQGQGPLAPFVPVLSLGLEEEAPLPPGHLRAVCRPLASRQPPGVHLPACLAGWRPWSLTARLLPWTSPQGPPLPCRDVSPTVLSRDIRVKVRAPGLCPGEPESATLGVPGPGVTKARL